MGAVTFRHLAAVLLLLPSLVVAAQPGQTPTVDDLAWLAGRWQGEAFGGRFEETWAAPVGGTMLGMFRLDRQGGPAFYELCLILEVDGRIEMRVKHFGPGLEGWETKDESLRFPLQRASPDVAEFDGLRIERREDGTLEARLRMAGRDGKPEHDEILIYRPVAP